jgi:hypothetical protein
MKMKISTILILIALLFGFGIGMVAMKLTLDKPFGRTFSVWVKPKSSVQDDGWHSIIVNESGKSFQLYFDGNSVISTGKLEER